MRKPPPRYITRPCPTCGHPERAINGAWLRHLREQAEFSQRQFGVMVHLSSPYLSDIERNRRDCPVSLQLAYESLALRKEFHTSMLDVVATNGGKATTETPRHRPPTLDVIATTGGKATTRRAKGAP